MKSIFLIIVSWAPMFGADIYFAPTSAGSNNGTSCANAYAYSDGTHGWSQSAQQVAGDTLHICSGTYTASSGGQLLTTANSGSSGSPITLIADQGAANFTSPIFGTSGAIAISKSYWTVNGSNNLTIQNTANGTGQANNAQSTGIVVSGTTTNVILENFIMQNMCQRSAGDTGDSCTTGGNDSDGISLNGTLTNITVQYVTIAQGGHNCIFYAGTSADTGIAIQYNTISGCNWGVAGNSAIGAMTINGLDITCVAGTTCNWDELADDNHHNGIYFFPGSGTANVTISNSYIHDINGNTTAYIFFTDQNGGKVNATIYNVVFFTTAGQSGTANGMITSGTSLNAVSTYNSTFYGPSAASLGSDSNSTNKNNIVVNGTCQESISGSGIVSSYNDFYQTGTPSCSSSGQNWYNGTSGFSTLSAWQAGSTSQCSGGCDVTGSITSNPNLTTAFVPNSGSPVISAGANLTSLGIAGLDQGAPQYFGVSYACGTGCVARPSSGGWTMGAYQFVSSGTGGSSTGSGVVQGTGVVKAINFLIERFQ